MEGETALAGIDHFRIFIRTEAWPQCLDFYQEALGLERLALDADAGFAIFRCAGEARPTIGLEVIEPDETEDLALAGRFTGLSFRVEDLASAYQSLIARGVAFEGAPEVMDWGGTLAHLRDPAGNILTLVELPSGESAGA